MTPQESAWFYCFGGTCLIVIGYLLVKGLL